MKAWLLEKMGDGIDSLHIAEVPDPQPGEGQVVIDLHFAGLNPADRYLAENLYPAKPAFPHILGRDGMGLVSAVGRGVTWPTIGERVTIITGDAGINLRGTFAEKLLANANTLARVPEGWTAEQAAGAPLVYLTAYRALNQWAADMPSDPVALITGASGGVGVAAVQLAKAMKYTVIGLSRSIDKASRLREIGADLTFDPTTVGWTKALKAALGKRRVNVAIDSVGGPGFNDIIDTLGARGRVTCVGRLAGPVPNFNTATLFFRELRIGGIAVHAYSPADALNDWNRIVPLMKANHAAPLVDSIHPFAEMRNAFTALDRGPMGKVLLRIPR